jgi:hypothetical protein
MTLVTDTAVHVSPLEAFSRADGLQAPNNGYQRLDEEIPLIANEKEKESYPRRICF